MNYKHIRKKMIVYIMLLISVFIIYQQDIKAIPENEKTIQSEEKKIEETKKISIEEKLEEDVEEDVDIKEIKSSTAEKEHEILNIPKKTIYFFSVTFGILLFTIIATVVISILKNRKNNK